ncbi:BrnT family toxin [Desulfobulbus alkaliphilus]|uniref:BrnT family toxin n=1 Tax=Desulfobulbus alkaliphilus TaxID=869814 RepID=UPI001963DCFF|nr:BrnT family toxin [Desulfobulbus alkaliphilus]MBM9538145.1 BrnT family toxin [Desulfobulbus alkaliphilus]
MKFEFDSQKSESNKHKHGVDFVEAQSLWDDLDLLEIPAKTVEDEGRCLVIGKIGGKYWSAVITYRGDTVRIISARRSREKEVEYYESSGI